MNASRGRVLGVDAAGGHGWLAVLVDDGGYVGAHLGSLDELVAWAEPVAVVGVDIPIGHGPARPRPADVEARRFVGRRRSSVFPAPPAAAVAAQSYAEANKLLAASGAPMMSKQAWNLVSRIVEAADVAGRDERIYEVHPEVSFCELAGEELIWSKKSWNGLVLRRRLLAGAGILLPDEIPDVAGAVSDDVVDAAVAAWSARRIRDGTARKFPDPPEEADGRQVAIWC